jgi:hypothetical protein
MRVIISLLLLTSTAYADEWTPTDSKVQLATTVSLAVDYAQTIRITDDGLESNPIMGTHGQHVTPHVYFPLVIAGQLALARVLPQPWRRLSQLLVIGVETRAISKNWGAGYTFEF